MIVKKVMAKKATGSFGGLADYLLDKTNDMAKVNDFDFNNCPFDNLGENLQFIKKDQQINQRTSSDKTLHLIVSFQEDEKIPNKEILKNIEEDLLRSIGMHDHHRLSVTHNNTNNFHIHIAINKLDPKTHNIINPIRDIIKLQKAAEEIEEKYNLKRDNHIDKNRRVIDNKQKQSSIEIHSGIKNFKNWIKEEALHEIKEILTDKKSTFDDLQLKLATYSLEIKPRGNGIVISDKNRKLFVKASDIDRNLSKGKLEKRFGSLEYKSFKRKSEKYFGLPKHNLWDEYKKLSQSKRETKKELFTAAKEQNTKGKASIKTKYDSLVQKTKADILILKKSKRIIYQNHFANRKAEYQELSKKYKIQRVQIFKSTNQISYKEYLIQKALEGDKNALAVIRNTKAQFKPDDNAIIGKTDHKIFITKDKMITKQGLVVYQVGDHGKIIDKGDHLKITVNDNDLAIKETLDMARAKYGNELDINGDIAFKQKVLAVSEKYDLNINFKDKIMNEIRLASSNQKRTEHTIRQDTKKGMRR